MAQDCITIKGTRGGLMILLDASRDFNELRANLTAKFNAAQGFFKGASFTLVPSSPLSSHEKEELEAICREYGLVPQANIALNFPYRPKKINRQADKPVEAKSWQEELPTLLEEGNLRNGQVINSDGHVMFVGDVHQGAVIKAVGNIMVMGTLMGSAHAGIEGNSRAVIVAHRLYPEQLGIARVIARSPEQKTKRPYPEIARLVSNKIIIEPYLKV